jgi:hypothetical protein
MPRRAITVPLFLSLLICWRADAFVSEPPAKPPRPVDFNRDIRPILAKNCFPCHGSDDKKRTAGLRLDEADSAVSPRKKGPAAIVPHNAAKSLLVERITSEDDDERMPPAETGNRLSQEQIDLLKRWIDEGAVYAKHWAFIMPVRPALPTVKQSKWVRNPIDSFILARLEQEGLKPSEEADRYQLVRRVSLDLRGLPPTIQEIDTFINDKSPDAYEKMVDRSLADTAFGERWARMWLDLARYADSAGYGSDPLRPFMWRYRDWVIQAFNQNKPYDQFTIEQLAGDLLPNPTLDQKIATAFHRNTMTNTEGGTDREEFRVAAVKDRINTTMQVWMGLTMGCAQCHSHKFDPITQKEYYQFYAIFNQTEDNDQPNESPTIPAPTSEQTEQNEKIDQQIAAVRKKMDQSTPELVAAQKKWEEQLQTNTSWTMLKPERLKSEQKTKLQSESDGTIRVSSPAGTTDTFRISTKLPKGTITGVRLETTSSTQGQRSASLPIEQLPTISASLRPADQSHIEGRFVRITLPGPNRILSVAEVQVFQDQENIARFGEASQSSLSFDGHAFRAIDGNTDGEYFRSKTVTHTQTENNPWWEVKLPALTSIDRIVVWNRLDGLEERIKGAKVQVLNDRHDVVWEQIIKDVPKPMAELDLDGDPLQLKRAFAGSQPGQCIFVTSGQVNIPEEKLLTIRLRSNSQLKNSFFDSFRLSVTNDPKLVERAAVPGVILTLLNLPVDKRTPGQQEEIARYYRTMAPLLAPLRDEIAKLEKSRPRITNLPVMAELPNAKRRSSKLMHKGNFLDTGETVAPTLPVAFALNDSNSPRQPPAQSQQKELTRLDVARWLVHPDNPLTARVAVNRFWAQLFGTGLVETEEDFGTQGELPSHPELLDWLATEYQQTLKWDTKGFLKLIVTSATYRQSSKVSPELLKRDPRNRLLGRAPRYRLEAEMVRDQALALSGLLSKKIGGPSVFPPQPDGLWQAAFNGERTWFSSKGEDRYRRGLYTFWRRTIPYPSMTAFDAPSRELCQVKRIRSNTPVQAFVTLNDPVFVEAAQSLARRIAKEGGRSSEERIRFALRLCLSCPPAEQQVTPLLALYQRELEKYRKDPKAADKMACDPLGPLPKEMAADELAAWTIIANVLINCDAVINKS